MPEERGEGQGCPHSRGPSDAHFPRIAGLCRWALPCAHVPALPAGPLPRPRGSRAFSLIHWSHSPPTLAPGRAAGISEAREAAQPKPHNSGTSTAGTARRRASAGAASWPQGRKRREAEDALPPGGRRTELQPLQLGPTAAAGAALTALRLGQVLRLLSAIPSFPWIPTARLHPHLQRPADFDSASRFANRGGDQRLASPPYPLRAQLPKKQSLLGKVL